MTWAAMLPGKKKKKKKDKDKTPKAELEALADGGIPSDVSGLFAEAMRLALRSVRGWKLLFLLKTRLHWSRAGKRTDYRIVRASQSLPLRHPIPARPMACSRSLHSDH